VNGKSMMILGLAIAIGLGAMVLTSQVLSQDSGKKEEETQEVLVALRDTKEEETLKPDMVKVIRMAKSAVPVGTFSSAKDLEDRWVKTALLEGDVIVEKKLGAKGTPPGLVANIPTGMRAFAVDVTEQSGVSGFILPGHRVDVVRFEPSERGPAQGETILQNILVLAAGQVFTRAEERALMTRTVTLAVTPDQVDILVAARIKGNLALSLRGVNDHEVITRPKPKPAVDEAVAKRWKLEEEKRTQLEQELRQLKEALAKKAAEPPPPPPPSPPPAPRQTPHYTTIYRGIDQVRRVRTDGTAVADLIPRPEAIPQSEAADRPDRLGLRLAPKGQTDDSSDP
jgi:pilus assembly protein CpaB